MVAKNVTTVFQIIVPPVFNKANGFFFNRMRIIKMVRNQKTVRLHNLVKIRQEPIQTHFPGIRATIICNRTAKMYQNLTVNRFFYPRKIIHPKKISGSTAAFVGPFTKTSINRIRGPSVSVSGESLNRKQLPHDSFQKQGLEPCFFCW